MLGSREKSSPELPEMPAGQRSPGAGSCLLCCVGVSEGERLQGQDTSVFQVGERWGHFSYVFSLGMLKCLESHRQTRSFR